MAHERRIESLQKRHTHLQKKIEFEEKRPHPDTALIQQLKREKLSIKEEIMRLMEGSQVAA